MSDKDPGPSRNEKNSRPPRKKTSKRNPLRRLWLLLLVVIFGVLIVAASIPVNRWVYATGYVITDEETELRPAVEAPIAEWKVNTDDLVKQGDVVIQLDDRIQQASLEEAQSNLARKQKQLKKLQSSHRLQRQQLTKRIDQARQTYDLRENTLERMLAAPAGFSPQEVEDAQLRVKLAQSELEEALLDHDDLFAQELEVLQGEIAASEKHVKVLEAEIAQRRVVAPIDGTVFFNSFEPGEVVKPEHVLGQVFNKDRWIVKIKISERDMRYVEIGQPVAISLTAYPSMRFGYAQGRVMRIFEVITPQPTGDGIFYAEVVITDPGRLETRPGQSARVWIDAGRTSYLLYMLGW